MARGFAKVSEEEIKTAFFYPSDLVNIPLRVGEEWWIHTSTLRVLVYIHHYSPSARGIVVYYSTCKCLIIHSTLVLFRTRYTFFLCIRNKEASAFISFRPKFPNSVSNKIN